MPSVLQRLAFAAFFAATWDQSLAGSEEEEDVHQEEVQEETVQKDAFQDFDEHDETRLLGELLNHYDADGDGMVSLDEAVSLLTEDAAASHVHGGAGGDEENPPEYVQKAVRFFNETVPVLFAEADDGDGLLTGPELLNMLEKLDQEHLRAEL
eukprot:TRINITY_DN52365_c0_g1_i1.p1 TRINITY_DN52365_c0_g1~~TRINITY_DN52365_c0_g1_i1.p1  ORF type:complete len:172 (-),score=52.59 TRINITY_DN52365_c0_g1_i1:40-498(-)